MKSNRDGIEVNEHVSTLELSQKDQELIRRLQESHEKAQKQTSPFRDNEVTLDTLRGRL